MPPIHLNRRNFLGYSAAASLAIAQGQAPGGEPGDGRPVRVGIVGAGNRGTSLLRALLELPASRVVAVCDVEVKHRVRGRNIAEKARGAGERPAEFERLEDLLAREDVDAVAVALPCDLHADAAVAAIRAGKHVYIEKPLAPTLEECDLVIGEASRRPDLAVHVGFQRRSHPRYREAVEIVRRGELGELIQADATWVSSNGPADGHRGWLGSRARSGDWMVEQAVHVWDVFGWLAGGPPESATAQGRRDLFARERPGRDVTDHYTAQLAWPGGFRATLLHSWAAPADDAFTGNHQRLLGTAGGLDLASGSLTYRDRARPRRAIRPGVHPDTRIALAAFLDAARTEVPATPPISLAEARAATLVGLLVRAAVDLGRSVSAAEIESGAVAASSIATNGVIGTAAIAG